MHTDNTALLMLQFVLDQQAVGDFEMPLEYKSIAESSTLIMKKLMFQLREQTVVAFTFIRKLGIELVVEFSLLKMIKLIVMFSSPISLVL